MFGWIIGLFAGLALAVLGIIFVMELVVLKPDLTDPIAAPGDLTPAQGEPKR